MEDSISRPYGEQPDVGQEPARQSVDQPPATIALVDWQRLADLGAALAVTSGASLESALGRLPLQLDRLTRPHQLLDLLNTDVEGVLAGDTIAARRLHERLHVLITSLPELIGSQARAQAMVEAPALERQADQLEEDHDESSLSFDALVRLAAAAALATRNAPAAALDSALDIILGLAMQTAAADYLVRGLARGGASGAAEALNTLRLLGHWAALPPLPMQTMSGVPGGIPGGLPGGHLPGSGPLGGPGNPDEIPGFVKKVFDKLRNRRRWDPEIWDGFVPWREIVGLPPVEVIDRAERERARCLLDLVRALKLRQEPPPARPAIVVWSDTIHSIEPNHGCAGDRIILHGDGFGDPDPSIGVMLPMADGCHAFAVPAADWTPTAITITLPTEIVSGTVGLVRLDYVRAYDDWAARMNELTKSIIKDAKCLRSKAPDVAYVPLFRECAPRTPFNHLRAGLPVIWSFKVNGMDSAFVEPGQSVQLEWDVRNADHFRLTHLPGSGPQFATGQFVDDPRGTRYDLGPYNGNSPQEAAYELSADGPCGRVTARVKVSLRKVPVLEVEGIEVTQAIQTFRDPESPPNAIPLVAQKDTIVRVYVAVENLAGFARDRVSISGRLTMYGPSSATITAILPPLNTFAYAQPRAKIDRTNAEDTLNFRITAALAVPTPGIWFSVDVWATDDVEAPPLGIKERPKVHDIYRIEWVAKRPYRVRYVLISLEGVPALDELRARELIVRAFDLLPTIPTDIDHAPIKTWHTSQNIKTTGGMTTLLGHIDDQHDCTLSERIFPWEEDCPDPDGAIWLGILPIEGDPAGITQGYGFFDQGRNTAIVSPFQHTIAHELGHTLKLNHVRPDLCCPSCPEGDYDTRPNGGAIRIGDAFDPHNVSVQQGYGGLYDFMTYWCKTWVSRDTWMRLFDMF